MLSEEVKTKIDAFVDEHQKDIIADIGKLIEIPSVSKPGSPEPEPFGAECAKVLDRALHMAEEKGMEAHNYRNWYGIATRGEGKHSVGIFTHLDVVEVDDSWTFPPFKLTEKDGWLFGRGINDDKLAAVIGMYTSMALDELNLGHNIKLELYLGCSEEKGMQDLDRYISEQVQPDFSMVPDFIFPVAVGGPGGMKFEISTDSVYDDFENFSGGAARQRVPLSASAIYTGNVPLKEADGITLESVENGIKVTAEGRAASGWGKNDSINAIELLTSYLVKSGAVRGRDEKTIGVIEKIARGGDGAAISIAVSDELYGDLKLTCQSAAEKEGRLTVTFSVNFPSETTVSNIVEHVTSAAENFDFKLIYSEDPWGISESDERVGILRSAWNEVCGRDEGVRTGGSTYAAKLKNAVNYGPKDMTKCPFIPEDRGNLHSADETRSIVNIMDAVKTYIRAVAGLDEWYGEKG